MIEWLYYLAAARKPEQLKQMQWLQENQVCVFCKEHFDEHHTAPVELESDHWVVTQNDYPYTGLRVHLLLVPRVHVTDISELPQVAGAELFQIYGALKKRYQLEGPVLVIRTGDMRRNGGSIAHLHAHLVEGDIDAAEHEPVRLKVSSVPKDWNALPEWAE